MWMPTRSICASSRAVGSSMSRYSFSSPDAASRFGTCSAIGRSACTIAPTHGAARSTGTPSRLFARPAIVARAGSSTPPSRCATASPGSASAVGSRTNAASIVSSATPATSTPMSANARITVLLSWQTFATFGSASTW